MDRCRKKSLAALTTTIIFIILVVLAAGGAVFLNGMQAKNTEEYEWISSDPAAKDGMLDGSFYTGKKNDGKTLSYKIAEYISVNATGGGDFKIENSGKNTCVTKVTMYLDEKVIYQTGYIKPNQHIMEDRLDTVPTPGEYTVRAVFEGFDPNTEESIGQTETEITLSVSNRI